MRSRVILATALVLSVLVGTAWALEVTFGNKTRAKATVVVDELGTILFGAVPAPVEVTNFPAATNCDCSGPSTPATVELSEQSPSTLYFADALGYSSSLDEATFDDWTMPSLDQLLFAASGGGTISGVLTQDALWTRTPHPAESSSLRGFWSVALESYGTGSQMTVGDFDRLLHVRCAR